MTPLHNYTKPTSLQFYLYMGDEARNDTFQVIIIKNEDGDDNYYYY